MNSNSEKETFSYHAINWLLLISCALIWGCSYYLIKQGLHGFEPMEIAGIRIVAAGLCLFPFLLPALRAIPFQKYPMILISALLGYGLPIYLYPLAQTHISSSMAGIINSLTPLCTYLIAILFFNMAGNRRKLGGVLIGMSGVVSLIVFKPQAEFSSELIFIFVALANPLLYGLNNNIRKSYLDDLDSLPLTSLIFGILLVPSLIFVFTSRIPEKLFTSEAAQQAVWYVVLLGVFGTAVAMTLINILIRRVDIMFATTVTYLMPVVAVGIGFYDHEQIGWYELLGLGLILTGVILINRTKSPA